MYDEQCPRCHEPLPAAACYEALPLVPGHLPAYRLRHKRMSGQTCIVYAGAAVAVAQCTLQPSIAKVEASISTTCWSRKSRVA